MLALGTHTKRVPYYLWREEGPQETIASIGENVQLVDSKVDPIEGQHIFDYYGYCHLVDGNFEFPLTALNVPTLNPHKIMVWSSWWEE